MLESSALARSQYRFPVLIPVAESMLTLHGPWLDPLVSIITVGRSHVLGVHCARDSPKKGGCEEPKIRCGHNTELGVAFPSNLPKQSDGATQMKKCKKSEGVQVREKTADSKFKCGPKWSHVTQTQFSVAPSGAFIILTFDT